MVKDRPAALSEAGMGSSDLKNVTCELRRLPIIVLNSHTHHDHVGDNWQFDTIYAMDTDFTRENARGSREDAQAEVGPGQVCGKLPKGEVLLEPRMCPAQQPQGSRRPHRADRREWTST